MPFGFSLLVLLFAGTLLLGGCAAPLADSPYQRIVKPQGGLSPHFVRVEASVQPGSYSVVSPSEPSAAQVREAVCQALGSTPFPCADPANPRERPEYILRLTYYVREMWTYRSMGGGRGILGAVQSGGRVFGDHDPAQDAAHEIVWRFTLARAEGGEALFRSEAFRRHVQFWSFDVKYWIERHFSE